MTVTENRKRVTVGVTGQQRTVNLEVSHNTGQRTVGITMLPVRSTYGQHALLADRLSTARQISLNGDVLGDTMFDGTEDVVIGTAVVCLTTTEIDELMAQSMAIGG